VKAPILIFADGRLTVSGTKGQTRSSGRRRDTSALLP